MNHGALPYPDAAHYGYYCVANLSIDFNVPSDGNHGFVNFSMHLGRAADDDNSCYRLSFFYFNVVSNNNSRIMMWPATMPIGCGISCFGRDMVPCPAIRNSFGIGFRFLVSSIGILRVEPQRKQQPNSSQRNKSPRQSVFYSQVHKSFLTAVKR